MSPDQIAARLVVIAEHGEAARRHLARSRPACALPQVEIAAAAEILAAVARGLRTRAAAMQEVRDAA